MRIFGSRRLLGSILSFFFFALVLPGISHAATLIVPTNFPTIQLALDAAGSGDVIQVKEGDYSEDIDVKTGLLTLLSVDGPGKAKIIGSPLGKAVTIRSGLGVTIDGFSIESKGGTAILHEGGGPTDPVVIINNTLQDGVYGFFAHWLGTMKGTDFTFTGNTVSDCGTGLVAEGFDGCTIRICDNTFTDCMGYGIQVGKLDGGMGTDAVISGNHVTLSGPFVGVCGIHVIHAEDTTLVTENKVDGPYDYGIHFEQVGAFGKDPAILEVEKNVVLGSVLSGMHFGTLAFSTRADVSVLHNTVENCGSGFHVILFNNVSGSSAVFNENNITGNSFGFANDSLELIDARNNWWGHASGPDDDRLVPVTPPYNNPSGLGDRVTAFVDYKPWLSEPWVEPVPPSGGGCSAPAFFPSLVVLLAPLAILVSTRR